MISRRSLLAIAASSFIRGASKGTSVPSAFSKYDDLATELAVTRLTDPAFQRTVASAILDGVDRYFARQPPPGTLYAARAQAIQSAQAATQPATGAAGIGGTGGSP